MGRRALRKIDPGLDLTWHLLEAEQLPPVCDPVWLFGRPLPLELEVGSGKGLFLRSAAAAHPDIGYLGVEISRKYARFAAAQLAKAGLRNARLIHGDAQRVIAERLPGGSLQAVHIYFPDPWWKKRHHKRRIMNPEFLAQVVRVLEGGGELHFWTDVEAYFQQSLEVIAQQESLEGPLEVPEPGEAEGAGFRTHFDRRMRLGGQPVYRSRFRKL